ncbi:uncharacterized protein LOC116610294 [Nematostella vectensis]|uniref:uncharacterized protein LOC116610294 n=1 Tax=Nematostella vectensis TaxID=45351 RepID=UPI0020775E0D|nr:uncharacterized protein LOC116610294 [Nematostella vectensis]
MQLRKEKDRRTVKEELQEFESQPHCRREVSTGVPSDILVKRGILVGLPVCLTKEIKMADESPGAVLFGDHAGNEAGAVRRVDELVADEGADRLADEVASGEGAGRHADELPGREGAGRGADELAGGVHGAVLVGDSDEDGSVLSGDDGVGHGEPYQPNNSGLAINCYGMSESGTTEIGPGVLNYFTCQSPCIFLRGRLNPMVEFQQFWGAVEASNPCLPISVLPVPIAVFLLQIQLQTRVGFLIALNWASTETSFPWLTSDATRVILERGLVWGGSTSDSDRTSGF